MQSSFRFSEGLINSDPIFIWCHLKEWASLSQNRNYDSQFLITFNSSSLHSINFPQIYYSIFKIWKNSIDYLQYTTVFLLILTRDRDAWPWPYSDRTVTVQWPFSTIRSWSFTVPTRSFLGVLDRSWPFLTVPDRSWPFPSVFYRLWAFTIVLWAFIIVLSNDQNGL